MPVQKFRTFREARVAQWMESDDPRLVARIRRWLPTARLLSPVTPPRGVRKFRSIEEANAERDAWPRKLWPVIGEPRRLE